jgi:hypothetical protein
LVVYLAVAWEVILLHEVDDWFLSLIKTDARTAELVAAAIDKLEADGPTLGRPLVDVVKSSKVHNLKELRPGSTGVSEVRLLFVFDPTRRAVLLVAGDKAGDWQRWYQDNVPLAEGRYERWLAGEYEEERK